jgi:hypothetical protein
MQQQYRHEHNDCGDCDESAASKTVNQFPSSNAPESTVSEDTHCFSSCFDFE